MLDYIQTNWLTEIIQDQSDKFLIVVSKLLMGWKMQT